MKAPLIVKYASKLDVDAIEDRLERYLSPQEEREIALYIDVSKDKYRGNQ